MHALTRLHATNTYLSNNEIINLTTPLYLKRNAIKKKRSIVIKSTTLSVVNSTTHTFSVCSFFVLFFCLYTSVFFVLLQSFDGYI